MATTRADVFSLRTFCLITGASRGYGQCVALRFAELLPMHSCIVLTARNEEGLKSTATQIRKLYPDIIVHYKVLDLATCEKTDFDALFSGFFSDTNGPMSKETFEQSLLVHNAGCLGDVTIAMGQQDKPEPLDTYWRINLTSLTVLNAVWHQFFSSLALKQRMVIGISSICALQPFKSWALYCAGKAARDMLLHAFAEEEPDTIVLNWAPGPIDTEMQVEARTLTADKDLRQLFDDMKRENKLLTPDDSVSRLIQLLRQNKFDTGSHIDYYDVE